MIIYSLLRLFAAIIIVLSTLGIGTFKLKLFSFTTSYVINLGKYQFSQPFLLDCYFVAIRERRFVIARDRSTVLL